MDPLVALAKKTVEEYVMKGTVAPTPDQPTPEMSERAGVFVCLKKHGTLRGCIGTFLPCSDTVAEEIIRNAVAAATEDPRFPSVEAHELGEMTYSVDVLSPPERVSDVRDLDPKRFGVIVVSGGRKGLLLPDLEGVETVEDQLRIAKMKAGISPGDPVEIFRFEVRRHH
jgi:AmmeMemoRadiSam system protein A